MKNNPFKVTEHLWKFLRKDLPEEKKERFSRYVEQTQSLKAIRDELEDKERLGKELAVFTSFDTEKALKEVRRKRQLSGKLQVRFRYAGIAAAVVLVLGITALWLVRQQEAAETITARAVGGYARVVLKTAGGQVYGLDTLSAAVGEEQRVAFDNRSGVLNVTELEGEETTVDVKNNVVEVPYGGTYILLLQDSTKVYVNSGSRLEFPSRFAKKERKVKVSGEVFFEVAHHTEWPFVVDLGQGQIRVLGTSFNVKAYPEEEVVFTTLVEGKVSFSLDARTETVLKPGEQLSFHKANGQTGIQRVDTKLYTAWKDGLFWFQDMPLEEILKIVARWFDLEIFYLNPEVKTTLFSGKMKMYSSVEDILRKFEKSDEIAFQLKGRTLTVYKK